MKKFISMALVLVLTLGVFTGCRRKQPQATTGPTTRPTTAPTTMPTTAPTTAPTTMPTVPTDTMPDIGDMIPGPEDTIDPSNGANETTNATGPRSRHMPRQ